MVAISNIKRIKFCKRSFEFFNDLHLIDHPQNMLDAIGGDKIKIWLFLALFLEQFRNIFTVTVNQKYRVSRGLLLFYQQGTVFFFFRDGEFVFFNFSVQVLLTAGAHKEPTLFMIAHLLPVEIKAG